MKGKLNEQAGAIQIKKPDTRPGLIQLSKGGRLKANANPKAHKQNDMGYTR